MTDFMELAKKRYSVKSFLDHPVEPEKIEKVLEAGRVAPTAKNIQPQHIYVLKSPAALMKVRELTPCTYGAPVVFFMGYDRTLEWTNPLEEGIHSGVEDVSIAATHMILEAAELGLGTCWVNYFPNTKTKEAFGLPETFVPVLLMPIGYAAENGKPLPNHTKMRPMSELVTEL